jgi:hypothetical protein
MSAAIAQTNLERFFEQQLRARVGFFFPLDWACCRSLTETDLPEEVEPALLSARRELEAANALYDSSTGRYECDFWEVRVDPSGPLAGYALVAGYVDDQAFSATTIGFSPGGTRLYEAHRAGSLEG